VKARTAQANQIRGLLGEFGIVFGKGIAALNRGLPEILEDAENGLPRLMRPLLQRLGAQLQVLAQQVRDVEREIVQWHRDNPRSRKLEHIPGVGPLTASAYVAALGDPHHFKNARQVPAWLGMVPRHEGTGGKVRLGSISKRGDAYLRTLFIHGARSVISRIEANSDQSDTWLKRLVRRNPNIAALALAAKNARIAWALLAHERSYELDYHAVLARPQHG
jgi:transposase